MIVGFPGETDAEFAETVDVCRQAGFSKIHIFPFSARRGTPAAEMADQLPKQVKQERGRELAAVEAELRDAYYATLRGIRLKVLVESPLEAQPDERAGASPPPAHFIGTSCRYAPVEIACTENQVGEFVTVEAGAAKNGHLTVAT